MSFERFGDERRDLFKMRQAFAPQAPANSPGLSLRVKVLYGVGEIANAVKIVTFGLYSLFFATSVVGLPATWIGVAGFITMAWDAVVDPCIGYLTDGKNSSSKRYRFMLIGALAMGPGFWGFFSPPDHFSLRMTFLWLIITSFVVRSATSMFTIPYYSLGATLSQDYHERTSIAAIRGMASTVGTLLTASLSFVVFFPDKVPGVDPKLHRAGYDAMGLTFGLVMTGVSLLSLLTVSKCGRYENAVDEDTQPRPGDFFRGLVRSLSNSSFRTLFLSSCLVIMGLAVNSSLLLYFLKYYAEVNGSAALSGAQACFFFAGLVGMLVWLPVSRRLEKHWLYVISATATSILLLSGSMLFGVNHLLGTGNVWALVSGYALTGFFNCIILFIPQSMLADVADEQQLVTGRRTEGALFGILSFGQQLATGAAIMLAGWLLEHFVRLNPGTTTLSAGAVGRIGIVYSWVPATLFGIAALLMLKYKLTRSRMQTVQKQLQGFALVPGSDTELATGRANTAH